LRTGKDGKKYVCGVVNLDDYFAGQRAATISTDTLRDYIGKRQRQEASNGTINRELALLRRMFRLAAQEGKLRDVPYFPLLKESAPRKGFLEYGNFQKLRQELPEHLRPLATLGYFTGMRQGEILGLRWQSVSLTDSQIRLEAGSTKNGEARTIPLGKELVEMLKTERLRNPASEFVFLRQGERIGSFPKSWRSACDRAKLPGLLFHDLRRSGVRNLVRAGVPEKIAMGISGHKTRSVFDRYDITSEKDLREAAAKVETYLKQQEKQPESTTAPTQTLLQ
jgi:integrase